MQENNMENLHRRVSKEPQEKSYYQMRCDFYEKFKTKIRPKILPFEKERLKQKKIADLLFSIFVFLGVLIILYGISSFIFGIVEFCPEMLAGILFSVPFFIFAMVSKIIISKNFERKIKTKVMPLVCSSFGKLYWASGRYQGDISLLNNSCIVPYYENSSYDDFFTGEHRGVNFEIIEADYTREEGSGDDKKTVTVFDGVILKLKMNKNFKGHTVIRPDSLLHSKPAKHLERTILEDVNFEKKFDVYTNDEIEARYLITPSFMERLTNLKTAFFANKVYCAFYMGHLFIGLYTTKDLFSLCSLDKPVDDFRQYNTLFEELLSIVQLIDHFKLDEKTGL